MGRLSAFRGVLAFPAPFLGGLLYDRFGYQAPVLANWIGIIFSTLAILMLVREPPREQNSAIEQA